VPQVTAGVQQLSTWATGDLLIYGGALGLVVIGFMCFRAGMAIAGFVSVVIGIAIASGAIGISRSVHDWFHVTALSVPSDTAVAALHDDPCFVMTDAAGRIAFVRRPGHAKLPA
jgi:hypothetical protein